jgi:hypothetical protein
VQFAGKNDEVQGSDTESEKARINAMSLANSWAFGILEPNRSDNILNADNVKKTTNVPEIKSVPKSFGWSNSKSALKDINVPKTFTTDLQMVLPEFKISSKIDLKSAAVGGLSESSSLVNIGNNPANVSFTLNHKFV